MKLTFGTTLQKQRRNFGLNSLIFMLWRKEEKTPKIRFQMWPKHFKFPKTNEWEEKELLARRYNPAVRVKRRTMC